MDECSVCHEFRLSGYLKITFDDARGSAGSGCEFCRILLAAMETIHPKGIGAPPDIAAFLDYPYKTTMTIKFKNLRDVRGNF